MFGGEDAQENFVICGVWVSGGPVGSLEVSHVALLLYLFRSGSCHIFLPYAFLASQCTEMASTQPVKYINKASVMCPFSGFTKTPWLSVGGGWPWVLAGPSIFCWHFWENHFHKSIVIRAIYLNVINGSKKD